MNVIYIIIVALFLIFKVVVKLNNTDEQQSAEVFPPIEPLILEEEEVVPQPLPKPSPAKTVRKPVQQKPMAPAPVEAAKEEPAKKERPSYGIKSKSDAKRAIIYSEIFKRKY